MDLHQLGQQRSVVLHRAIARRLDTATVQRALARVDAGQARGSLHARFADEWRTILALPLDQIRAALVAGDERTTRLRSVSQFAGELSARERWALWRQVRELVSP